MLSFDPLGIIIHAYLHEKNYHHFSYSRYLLSVIGLARQVLSVLPTVLYEYMVTLVLQSPPGVH